MAAASCMGVTEFQNKIGMNRNANRQEFVTDTV